MPNPNPNPNAKPNPNANPNPKVDPDAEIWRLVNIHGGWTYSAVQGTTEGDKYILGFDTGHLADSIEGWPRWQVVKHILDIKNQMIEIEKSLNINGSNE